MTYFYFPYKEWPWSSSISLELYFGLQWSQTDVSFSYHWKEWPWRSSISPELYLGSSFYRSTSSLYSGSRILRLIDTLKLQHHRQIHNLKNLDNFQTAIIQRQTHKILPSEEFLGDSCLPSLEDDLSVVNHYYLLHFTFLREFFTEVSLLSCCQNCH